MKLLGSHRSPFVRKVMVAAHELGLGDHLDIDPVVVSFTKVAENVLPYNPLGQIPTLVLDDGTSLHDSLTICEYLDTLHGENRLVPAAGAARWKLLTRHALAQGMIETLMKLFGERKRTDALHALYTTAYIDKFLRTLPACEVECRAAPDRPLDLGDITLACALSYADFRFADLDWRAGHPAVAERYAAIAARPSMRASALHGEPAG